MAGYSSTPLAQKLGLKASCSAQLVHAVPGWQIADAPAGIVWRAAGDTTACDVVLAFFGEAKDYLAELDALGARVFPAGFLWIAWPRKAAGHVSDLNDNLIRDAALERGLVDVKVAALDDDWSALKLVWRVERRGASSGR